jgi:hypothetical protein
MIVKTLTVWHTTIEFKVDSVNKAREYAKRIITEGLWHIEGDTEIFIPVHNLVKVKIVPKEKND